MESENSEIINFNAENQNEGSEMMTDDDFFDMLDNYNFENVEQVDNFEEAILGAIENPTGEDGNQIGVDGNQNGENGNPTGAADLPPPLIRLDFLSSIPAMSEAEMEAYREALRPSVS